MTREHPKDPLHGITLERIVTELSAHYGWAELASRVRIRCFEHDPSVGSSLKFLRRPPWARSKVEAIYVELVHERAHEKAPDALASEWTAAPTKPEPTKPEPGSPPPVTPPPEA